MRACVCARTCMLVCMHACTRACVCPSMRACVCMCVRARACACVRAYVQALQVCMPALVCKCRHVYAFVPCGAQDILAGTLLVLLRDPLCVHGMWCLQHSKGYVFVFYGRPKTNLSRARSVVISRIEANRRFQFWHALYLENSIAL